MPTRFADIIDPQLIEETIPDDYANQAKLVISGVVGIEPETTEGTQASFIKETLFQSEDEGQAIGADGEVTLKDKAQVKYQIPVFWRADGALLDDIIEEITSKNRRDIALNISNAVQEKALQIQDGACIHTLEGCGLSLAALNQNYLDTGASAITLALIQSAKSKRDDRGAFLRGVMVMRSLMYHKLCSLGLVANDSNTMTNEKRNEILSTDTLGTILGMDTIMTDKLSLAAGGDYYTYLCEMGALRVKTAGRAPTVDPIIRTERGFQDIIKFRLKMGAGLVGMSWGGTASDLVTNTDLATAGNWTVAKTNVKNVPLVVLRTPAPTI